MTMISKAKYSPGAVANYFLKKARESGKEIDHMQLQKLMYFAHGWHLAFFNQPLIDEPFGAWEHGPVCESVYHEFKRFGANNILSQRSSYMTEIRFSEDGDLEEVVHKIKPEDLSARKALDVVWEKYSDFSGLALSKMTHLPKPDNPWIIARSNAVGEGVRRGNDISNRDIRKYFEQLAATRSLF